MLRKMADDCGFQVEEVEEVKAAGARISSSRIREMIGSGDVETAGLLLGHPFALIGSVAQGEQLGGKLGFPTANIKAENELLPQTGVYITAAHLDKERHPSVTNVGHRPTVGGVALTVESHLLDFSGDLYNKRMEVE